MILALAGFFAGLVHVFSGPDHLTAVAPWAVTQQRRAWLSGLRWGLGHTAGVFLVGILLILFRELLPLDQISTWQGIASRTPKLSSRRLDAKRNLLARADWDKA